MNWTFVAVIVLLAVPGRYSAKPQSQKEDEEPDITKLWPEDKAHLIASDLFVKVRQAEAEAIRFLQSIPENWTLAKFPSNQLLLSVLIAHGGRGAPGISFSGAPLEPTAAEVYRLPHAGCRRKRRSTGSISPVLMASCNAAVNHASACSSRCRRMRSP
jgi:hypothetical protein